MLTATDFARKRKAYATRPTFRWTSSAADACRALARAYDIMAVSRDMSAEAGKPSSWRTSTKGHPAARLGPPQRLDGIKKCPPEPLGLSPASTRSGSRAEAEISVRAFVVVSMTNALGSVFRRHVELG